MAAKSNALSYIALAAGGVGLFVAYQRGMLQSLLSPAAPLVSAPQVTPPYSPGVVVGNDGSTMTPSQFKYCDPNSGQYPADVCACMNIKGASGWTAATCADRLGKIRDKYNMTKARLAQVSSWADPQVQEWYNGMGPGLAVTQAKNTADSYATLSSYPNITGAQKIEYANAATEMRTRAANIQAGAVNYRDIFNDYKRFIHAENLNAFWEFAKYTGMSLG